MSETQVYEVRTMVDGLGGVYLHGSGSLCSTHQTLPAAVEAAADIPGGYVLRVGDGRILMPDGTWA